MREYSRNDGSSGAGWSRREIVAPRPAMFGLGVTISLAFVSAQAPPMKTIATAQMRRAVIRRQQAVRLGNWRLDLSENIGR